MFETESVFDNAVEGSSHDLNEMRWATIISDIRSSSSFPLVHYISGSVWPGELLLHAQRFRDIKFGEDDSKDAFYKSTVTSDD